MKSNTHPTQFLGLFVLVLLCALCGKSSAQDFKVVHPGVEYAQATYTIGSDPVKINLLRLDLSKVRLDVHHAFDLAIGVEPTSSIAKRHGAVAAINAGFFRLDKTEFAGDAAGLMVVDGELYSESTNDRIALVIRNGERQTIWTGFDHLTAYANAYSAVLEMPETNGINRERKKGEIILYSPRFGTTTRTEPGGTEIVLEDCRTTTCRDFRILSGAGNSPIPANGYVLSIDSIQSEERRNFLARLAKLPKKDRGFVVEHEVRPFNFLYVWRKPDLDIAGRLPLIDRKIEKSVDIVAGVPQLIKKGKIDITWEQEKASRSFAETRHPRTAVAKLKDGKFLMITVDGRQPGVSVGMTLQELAEYLFSVGAIDAMNLDGGGSTTMFLDGRVVNTPSDKEGERKVSDAIVVTPWKKRR